MPRDLEVSAGRRNEAVASDLGGKDRLDVLYRPGGIDFGKDVLGCHHVRILHQPHGRDCAGREGSRQDGEIRRASLAIRAVDARPSRSEQSDLGLQLAGRRSRNLDREDAAACQSDRDRRSAADGGEGQVGPALEEVAVVGREVRDRVDLAGGDLEIRKVEAVGPAPPVMVSLPRPPTSVSSPAPPSRRSASATPAAAKAKPNNTSPSSPPVRTSTPVPPLRVSPPAPPTMLSSSAFPNISSEPSMPNIVSLPSSPCSRSSPMPLSLNRRRPRRQACRFPRRPRAHRRHPRREGCPRHPLQAGCRRRTNQRWCPHRRRHRPCRCQGRRSTYRRRNRQ